MKNIIEMYDTGGSDSRSGFSWLPDVMVQQPGEFLMHSPSMSKCDVRYGK